MMEQQTRGEKMGPDREGRSGEPKLTVRANPIHQASRPGIHRPNTVFSRECWHVYRPAGSALQPESTDQCFQVGSPPKPEQ